MTAHIRSRGLRHVSGFGSTMMVQIHVVTGWCQRGRYGVRHGRRRPLLYHDVVVGDALSVVPRLAARRVVQQHSDC